jgi:methylmalonyl-CoA/ethylmalonyl-CoA epimerase
MKKLEHVGIAVKDLAAAQEIYTALFGEPEYKTEEVASEQVKTAFYRTGETKIELLEATGPDSAIATFIDKRGEGLHHIAFEVDDIEAEMQRLLNQGFRLLNEQPKRGADNKRICFLHPKSANGVLIELCQSL